MHTVKMRQRTILLHNKCKKYDCQIFYNYDCWKVALGIAQPQPINFGLFEGCNYCNLKVIFNL